MEVSVNANISAEAWANLVSKLTDASNTENVSQVNTALQVGDQAANVTVSYDARTGNATFTVEMPTLEQPQNVDTSALSTALAKLEAMTGSDILTEDDQKVADALVNEVVQLADAKGVGTTSSKTFFDLYALMTLLVEVAQEERDAAREARSSEYELQAKSIQNQADEQRSAAKTGLIGAVIVGVIQVAVQVVSSVKAAGAAKSQIQQSNAAGLAEMGQQVKTAQTTLTEMQKPLQGEIKCTQQEVDALQQKVDQKQQTVDAKAQELAGMEEGDLKTQKLAEYEAMNGDLETMKANLTKMEAYQTRMNSTEVTQQRAEVNHARADFMSRKEVMENSPEFKEARQTEAKAQMVNQLAGSIGGIAQGIVRSMSELRSAEATREGATQKEAEARTKDAEDLFSQAGDLVAKVVQLFKAVIEAEVQSQRDAIQA